MVAENGKVFSRISYLPFWFRGLPLVYGSIAAGAQYLVRSRFDAVSWILIGGFALAGGFVVLRAVRPSFRLAEGRALEVFGGPRKAGRIKLRIAVEDIAEIVRPTRTTLLLKGRDGSAVAFEDNERLLDDLAAALENLRSHVGRT